MEAQNYLVQHCTSRKGLHVVRERLDNRSCARVSLCKLHTAKSGAVYTDDIEHDRDKDQFQSSKDVCNFRRGWLGILALGRREWESGQRYSTCAAAAITERSTLTVASKLCVL